MFVCEKHLAKATNDFAKKIPYDHIRIRQVKQIFTDKEAESLKCEVCGEHAIFQVNRIPYE